MSNLTELVSEFHGNIIELSIHLMLGEKWPRKG
jgi:hypothetical protein